MSEPETPLLIRAFRGEPTPRRPVWLMRQAGRYLPGYQEARAEAGGFLELCRRPDLACVVSLEPVERFALDAAIVFSDILLPLEAMGMDVRFDDRGPFLPEPLRSVDDVSALQGFEPEVGTPWILETISQLVDSLPAETPVIGFAGAPLTLAAYAVEGRITKSLVHIKSLRFRDEPTFVQLLDTLADSTVPYLVAQARAGASVLQLFDTWAGEMSADDWTTLAAPPIRRIFDGVRAELGADAPPLVLFTKGTSSWLPSLLTTGADAYSVDWRTPLARAKELLGGAPVQGNLDPTVLHADHDAVRRATRVLLDDVAGQDGVVVNLGHGVIVGTPPENVAAFVAEVRAT